MTPVVLRHPRATPQALLMGGVALILTTLTLLALALPGWFKLLALVQGVLALIFTYLAVRTATLKVRLDHRGLWEPNPFRLTYVTPWTEISQIRKGVTKGRVTFVGVQIVYKDGEERDILALKMQAKAAGTEDTVDGWVDAIRAAKVQALA